MRNDRSSVIQRKLCPINCNEHVFQTTPHQTGKTWMKSEIKVDFCPIQNDSGCHNIVPILNNDSLSCLPGFILEFDKIDYQNHMKRHKEEHERKIQEYTLKKNIMLLPKPGKKHRYCGVCRRQYDEYLEHIQSQDHILNFKHHRFVGLISTMIRDTYGEGNIKEEKKVLFSFQESSTQYRQTPIIIEDDQPQKKRGRPPKNSCITVVSKPEQKEKKNEKKIKDQMQGYKAYVNPYLYNNQYKLLPNFSLYPEQCLQYQSGGQQFLLPQSQFLPDFSNFQNQSSITNAIAFNFFNYSFMQNQHKVLQDNKNTDKNDGYILT